MRSTKFLATAVTAFSLVASPVMAAPARSATGLSMSSAVAAASLHPDDTRRSKKKFRGAAWLFVALGAAIGTTLALTLGKDDDSYISLG